MTRIITLSEEIIRLSLAANRVNAARNAVGNLKHHLANPAHRNQVNQALDLIIQAEAILEGLRETVPVRTPLETGHEEGA